MTALRFDNVSKTYLLHKHNISIGAMVGLVKRPSAEEHIFYALKNVTFEIRKGEAFGIIGRNGAGKSTILKIISGITRQSSGQVEVHGLVSSLIELGAGFHPDLTGRENVYMNGAIMGIPKKKIDEKFEEIVDFAELWEFIDVPVKKYSSGMYARLGFAVAVSVDPEVLIVDEILSVGDVFFQQKCFAKMRQIKETGTTFIFVTHDTAAMQNLCDRAMLLDAGKIEYVGTTTEVVNRYYARVGQRPEKTKISPTHVDGKNQVGGLSRESIIDNSILPENSKRHGDRALEIIGARVINAQGSDTLTVPMGETLRFYLLIRANEDIARPCSGLNLFDRMGNLVFSAGTPQLNVEIPSLSDGQEILLQFDLEFSVRPGEYTFTLVTSEPSADGNPNTGFFHDVLEMLGPINVVADTMKVFPFYGIARLPMKINVGAPYRHAK